jgi:deoxyribonuclease-1
MFKKIITIKKAICLIIALSCVGGVITIVQAEVLNFNKAKKELTKIYKSLDDPRSFYCNCPIVSQGKKLVPDIAACGYTPYKQAKRATRIEYEHIMPASWLGRQLQCWQNGGRKGCKNNRAFNIREGDMHNLVPAIGEINAYRSNYRFNLIPSKSKSSIVFSVIEVEIRKNARGSQRLLRHNQCRCVCRCE